MNFWDNTIDKLIYKKDKATSELYLKGKFYVLSTIIFFFLAFISIPYYLIFLPKEVKIHPDLFYANVVFTLMILAMIYIYKKWGGRIALVNVVAFFGIGSIPSLYQYGGGIYAPDNVWGIVIASWVFLVANRISGYFWMIFAILTIIFFYYVDICGFKDFKAESTKLTGDYYFMNYMLMGIFLLLIITLYESSKTSFVKELAKTNSQLESRKAELELKSKDIIDSINYAKKIQYAVLPHEETIYRSIPLSFIYYKPKDIVSGDFFWFHEINANEYILVCADCTGHGVPGAFMTVIGSSLLNQTVIDNKITEPSKILQELDKLINFTLKQQKDSTISVQDGMDLSLIKVNKAKKEFNITGAKRPVIFIRNKEMQELKGSKFSLGGLRSGDKKFDEIVINYQEEDMLYLYTDGYTDQFGGEKGKKFSSKRLKEHFINIHRMSVAEQKQSLGTVMDKWMGGVEQVDDMLVIGIKL